MRSFKIAAMLVTVFLTGCDSSETENGGSNKNSIHLDSSVPLIVVLRDMGDGFQESPSTLLIKQTVSGESVESPDNATVMLEEDIPTDDSVAAVRYNYQLSNINGIWKIDSKNVTQRCVSGRGHTDFSKEFCQ
ncbi:MAG: hypothetical protein ACRCUG_09970 [Yersinia sp. (in: enterobacteria)]